MRSRTHPCRHQLSHVIINFIALIIKIYCWSLLNYCFIPRQIHRTLILKINLLWADPQSDTHTWPSQMVRPSMWWPPQKWWPTLCLLACSEAYQFEQLGPVKQSFSTCQINSLILKARLHCYYSCTEKIAIIVLSIEPGFVKRWSWKAAGGKTKSNTWLTMEKRVSLSNFTSHEAVDKL